jgi:hypothetical protein
MSKITFTQNKKEIILNLFVLQGNKRKINIHIDTDCIRTSDEMSDDGEEEHNYESDIDEISNDDIYYESESEQEIDYDEQEIELNDDEIESI